MNLKKIILCQVSNWDIQTKINTMTLKLPGGLFNVEMPSYQYRKFHCGDRWSYHHLFSTMGFPILVRWHHFIESGPRLLRHYISNKKKIFQIIFLLEDYLNYSQDIIFNDSLETHTHTCISSKKFITWRVEVKKYDLFYWHTTMYKYMYFYTRDLLWHINVFQFNEKYT